ncbi:SOUL family heme-binding protein [Phenylobacterium sp.]|jgi:hypothetical protein|uniref:SOUL family heme-binding protein n=1 Tax=Phenylobacterium sp. TaxID=1871053 RepID=UPI0037CBD4A7
MTVLKLVGLIVGVISSALTPGLARAATEQPAYTVLQRVGSVELRRYGPRLAAETTVRGDEVSARNKGFQAIAGYIFGGNKGKTSIAMTAPVAQAKAEKIAMTAPVAQAPSADGAWRVQFFMPAKYTRATLPTPNNPEVRIVELPSEQFAVLRFSGLAGRTSVAARTKELSDKAAAMGWKVTGPPVVWFYDPPWTLPPMRRNEVAFPVAAK